MLTTKQYKELKATIESMDADNALFNSLRKDFGLTEHKAKIRNCLSCGSLFASESAGHRTCDKCKLGAH